MCIMVRISDSGRNLGNAGRPACGGCASPQPGKEVGSPQVKINWDLYHMQRYEGNLIDNLRKNIDHVGYFQLADSPDRNEPLTGEINYTEVFKAIKQAGYKRPVGLECSPQDGNVVRAAQRINTADTW